MRKLFTNILLIIALGLSSCTYDDTAVWSKLDDHESRISTLEELCREMNTNISALQTLVDAMQGGDYITSIVPVTKDGTTVGYTITFAENEPITIYHGTDGKDGANGADGKDGTDGADGKDGYTPVIGVKQDTDGIYYWTLDGEWLLDDAGNKIKAVGTDGKDGQDGADGTNGTNGEDGADGITPQLKIKEGYWYVSYDNGTSWTQLGKATGENGQDGADGEDGADGKDGDSFFQSVDTSNPDYIVFTLTDGTEIKIPTWYSFEQLQEKCNQMNSNIDAIQTIVAALQDKDYIESVTPIVEDGKEVGYTIVFAKSGAVNIYHGKDGADGANGADGVDGKDGYTPVIGVKQDSDGIYYWTLDGTWLLDDSGNKIKAVGADGKDGQDGANGADGTNGNDGANGTDGKDGVDGITPQLKIEEGYWYVSYDNGASWTQLGKATGEDGQDGANGADGADGKDGDSFFQSVDTSNPDYIVFTLTDGTEIKIPTWYSFEQLQEKCNQMNSNIDAIQAIVTALQEKDYVESVTPIVEDGKEVGYTIVFAKSGAVNIYHGKDGADGANGADGVDGKDGYTPVIGVKQDTDGIYYWTLDGEWLLDDSGNKIKAVGTDGKDGEDGADGKDGQDGADGTNGTNGENGADGKDGQDGADGVDGITPQLKIEDDYWYVSYDNGTSWTQLGKATGENGQDGADGEDGADGKDGDSFFADVVVGEDSVTFTLADGTVIVVPLKGSEDTSAENNKIYYTTSDGKKLFPNTTEPSIFGAILISNVYKDGQGVLTFDDSVTSIGQEAFRYCTSLTSVTIPDSVTSIGNAAFRYCYSLTSVTIGNGVTSIGKEAFYWCESLTSITIPDSVTTIGNSAFYWCYSLESITIPDSVTSIGNGAFFDCTSLTSVTIGNGVTSIGGRAFENCTSLTSVTIGNGVTSIGGYAFSYCSSLTSVTIGNGVTSIGGYAFSYCSSLESFYGKFASEDNRCLIVDGKLIAFAPAGLIEYTIPDSVTSIGDYAFSYCSSLTSVTIGNSVTSIGGRAFENCTSLTSVTIGNGVTSIGGYAFSYCSSLTSVTIPDSVTTIGKEVFENCNSLQKVFISDLSAWCRIDFANYDANPLSNSAALYINGELATDIIIPDSVTSIGGYAFEGCSSLTSVTIPDSVTTIGWWAFENCTSLTSVYCKPTTPPAGDYDMFESNASGRKIYVPTASVEAYKSAAGWSDYASDIVGYEF